MRALVVLLAVTACRGGDRDDARKPPPGPKTPPAPVAVLAPIDYAPEASPYVMASLEPIPAGPLRAFAAELDSPLHGFLEGFAAGNHDAPPASPADASVPPPPPPSAPPPPPSSPPPPQATHTAIKNSAPERIRRSYRGPRAAGLIF